MTAVATVPTLVDLSHIGGTLVKTIDFAPNGNVSRVEFIDLSSQVLPKQDRYRYSIPIRMRGGFNRVQRNLRWTGSRPQRTDAHSGPPLGPSVAPGPAMAPAKIAAPKPVPSHDKAQKLSAAKTADGIIRHLSDWPGWRG